MNEIINILVITLHVFYFGKFKNKMINKVTLINLVTTLITELFILKSSKIKISINLLLTILASFLVRINKEKSNIASGGAFYINRNIKSPLALYIKDTIILMLVLNIIFIYNPLSYYLHGSMWFNGNLG